MKKIKNLKEKLNLARNHKIYVGYYADQGEHPTAGLTYVELMTIHEFGAPSEGIPARPVLNITQGYGHFSQEDKVAILKAFEGVFVKNIPLEQALNRVGEYYQQKAYQVFGSGALLPTKRGNPPLIDTGELSNMIQYRTTFKYTTQG